MACKYVNGQYIFHQPCDLWNAPYVQVFGYIHLSSSTPGSRKKFCATGCLSSACDNFDEELMMDHDLDKLSHFLRQAIIWSPEFLKKSSKYKKIVTMAATVVCTTIIRLMDSHRMVKVHNPFSWTVMSIIVWELHQVPRKHCCISYFIFDDIASLAGSADTQNVDPVILSNICKGLVNENPYCIDLRFLEVEACQRAEGINVVPRMVHQGHYFDVWSVVNNRQTSAMTLQVKLHTHSVSDINMDSEKVEGLCFPLLFPHGEPGYTNLSKSCLSPDEYVMAKM